MVEELDASGRSQSDFAIERGIKVQTLRAWIYRLRDEELGKRDPKQTGTKADEAVRMLPVTVRSSPRGTPEQMEITLANATVRFPVGTDAEYVGALLLELEASC